VEIVLFIVINKQNPIHTNIKKKNIIGLEINFNNWHANPNIYKTNENITFPNNQIKLTNDIWLNDKIRVDALLKQFNIQTLIIWEDKVTNNKQNSILKCIEFLNGENK